MKRKTFFTNQFMSHTESVYKISLGKGTNKAIKIFLCMEHLIFLFDCVARNFFTINIIQKNLYNWAHFIFSIKTFFFDCKS